MTTTTATTITASFSPLPREDIHQWGSRWKHPLWQSSLLSKASRQFPWEPVCRPVDKRGGKWFEMMVIFYFLFLLRNMLKTVRSWTKMITMTTVTKSQKQKRWKRQQNKSDQKEQQQQQEEEEQQQQQSRPIPRAETTSSQLIIITIITKNS